MNQRIPVWGLLALAKSRVADRSPSRSAGSIFQESEQAARRALALDEREPNALVVLAMLQRNLDDWLTTERKLRAVLADADVDRPLGTPPQPRDTGHADHGQPAA